MDPLPEDVGFHAQNRRAPGILQRIRLGFSEASAAELNASIAAQDRWRLRRFVVEAAEACGLCGGVCGWRRFRSTDLKKELAIEMKKGRSSGGVGSGVYCRSWRLLWLLAASESKKRATEACDGVFGQRRFRSEEGNGD
nr:hypothetical protein Itr_chr06CG15310 [Ipomoea trifida]GMD03930.1 hypothetical protein Iba_chr06aCG13620 [Ipomoea batatas]